VRRHSPKQRSKASYYNICNGTRGQCNSESLFCSCVCIDSVAVSHELYSSDSFTPCWDCAWGKNDTLQTFIEHHPSSRPQYCQHHKVKYCIPTSSRFLYLRILCFVWHELTTCFYYGQLKKWTRFELYVRHAWPTLKNLNSTDICWCNLTTQTGRINVIRSSVLQKRGKLTERETDVHNLLYILSLCAALLEATRYLVENQIGI